MSNQSSDKLNVSSWQLDADVYECETLQGADLIANKLRDTVVHTAGGDVKVFASGKYYVLVIRGILHKS